MSNSVVKVTDSILNDSLLLLVGEDGIVTPNKDLVEAFLDTREGSTNLQVMHVKKCSDQSINLSVDNMVYVQDSERDGTSAPKSNLNEIARNLYNIKLDHDYTQHCLPLEEDDELAKTLSILDGANIEEPYHVSLNPPQEEVVLSTTNNLEEIIKSGSKQSEATVKNVIRSTKKKSVDDKSTIEGNDSDLDWDESKDKKNKKGTRNEQKSKIKLPKPNKLDDDELQKCDKLQLDKSLQETKKISKKEKRLSKSVPDDFALFSTPDIIRRVGGKETAVSTSPTSTFLDSSTDIKPAKIENRSKSTTETCQSSPKAKSNLDHKYVEKSAVKLELKAKDNKIHPVAKARRNTVDSLTKRQESLSTNPVFSAQNEKNLDQVSTSVDSVLINDKRLSSSFSEETSELTNTDQNLALDGTELDLDPTLLENINNDLISEDILFQVAQSLVSNRELQNAIDKSLSEDNLSLDPTIQKALENKPDNLLHLKTQQITSNSNTQQRGTQIVRPDGRIVVIPPIERPTTRSRNKTSKEIEKSPFKLSHKPLDEEHVSGNELDSSGDGEEESEDHPNKLWCICNQPHNNRFMICCDTCEEWYHGKCVNITKAMGQQMESEGKEWICLFCKDPHLRRPQAAARRIRKASRNSRHSTESTGSLRAESLGSVPCVVCQKPSRSNSIFCSEACILAHAQGVERVVVFERSTGNMLTGNKAPSASSLEHWLKQHPGYEVVRSAGKIVTTKAHNIGQSKFKITKNLDETSGSDKSVNVDLKNPPFSKVSAKVNNIPGLKIVSKQVNTQKVKPSNIHKGPFVSTKIKTPSPSIKVSSNSTSNSTSPGKERTVPQKIQKTRHTEQTTPTNSQGKQENIRENVQKTLFEQLTNRLKLVDDLKLSEDDLKSISVEIESQLYKCFGDTGQKYRNKYRSLIFNIKDIKNQTLWRRICQKSINPYQLVRLSPDDLASQELALWRERETKHQLDMIKKSELELLKCNRQYVLKTHKGEQILEDNHPAGHIDNSEVLTTLTDGTNGEKTDHKKDLSKDYDKKSGKRYKDKDKKSSHERIYSKDHSTHRSSSKDYGHGRKRSRSRDKNSKHSGRRRSRSRGREKHKRSSHKSSRHKKDVHRGSSTDKLDKKSKEILEQLVDNKIVPPLEDRLWKHVIQDDVLPTPIVESDSDHEPTSTVTIPTPPRNIDFEESMGQIESKVETDEHDDSAESLEISSEAIWKGIINMIDVAQISITAHEVSGDCGGLGLELPANLDIVGRISPDTVWDYIGKMKSSNSKIISVVRLNAINVEEKMPYLALYSYLSSRNRLGVVKSTNKAVKDFYILPLASQKPIPQVLLPLNGPGFEEARPALLLGILVRDKRKRPLFDSIGSAGIVLKKPKTELHVSTPPPRSYTPPPIKDPRVKLPLPLSSTDHQDDDEPYSPEDSDPDIVTPSTTANASFLEADVPSAQPFEPFSNKFDDIPGLDNPPLPSSTQEIQRQMDKLNKEIEMQKSEINSISQNIATASTEIGSSALANIALPSNLQQILDSIKTIGSATTDSPEIKPVNTVKSQESSDFTIPLILPTSFSRPSFNTNVDRLPDNTIPLNLPNKKKNLLDTDKPSNSVLGSLSEEDLIRKAEEMLGSSKNDSKDNGDVIELEDENSFKPASRPASWNNATLDDQSLTSEENDKI